MGLLTRALPRLARPTLEVPDRRSIGWPQVTADTLLPGGHVQGQGVEGLRASAVVHACVRTIVNPLAALDVAVDRPGEDRDLNHPMAVLLNRSPNPAWSARALKAVLWTRLEYRGEAFLYLDRGLSGGDVREVWPIFHRVDVVPAAAPDGSTAGRRAAGGGIAGYIAHVDGKRVPLLPDEVLWLRYPDGDDPYAAQAPWRSAEWAAGLDAYAREWQAAQMRNRTEPDGMFYLGDVDEAAHNAAVQSWRTRHGGARNAAKTMFLSGPVKAEYQRVSLTAAEVSYIDTRRVSWEEVMLAFGVHPDLLRGGATYENQRAAKVNLWTETLVPKTEVVASEADRQLLPDTGETFVLDLSGVEALQESADAEVERTSRLLVNDVLLVDEARERVGLEPLPGGIGQQTLTYYRKASDPRAPGEGVDTSALLSSLPGQSGPPQGGQDGAPPPAEGDAVGAEGDGAGQGGEDGQRAAQQRARFLTAVARQRKYERLERQGHAALGALADAQERVVLRALEAAERRAPQGASFDVRAVPPGRLFDVTYWRERSREFLRGWMQDVWQDGGDTTGGALGVSFDLFNPQVLTAMDERLTDLAEKITDTTYNAIQGEVLLPGVAEGESVPQLRDRLRSVFTTLRTSRAETIARTEVVGGFNAASRIAAVASGQVVRREWLATQDSRTRDTHRHLDGYRTQGMGDAYPNGVMHPGDPKGKPAETINCRCTEIFLQADE